jgi:hypothetical protein
LQDNLEGALIRYSDEGFPQQIAPDDPADPHRPSLWWCEACLAELVEWIKRSDGEPLPISGRSAAALAGAVEYPGHRPTDFGKVRNHTLWQVRTQGGGAA